MLIDIVMRHLGKRALVPESRIRFDPLGHMGWGYGLIPQNDSFVKFESLRREKRSAGNCNRLDML